MTGGLRRAIVGLTLGFAMATGQSVADAQSDPYLPGTSGYDVSYPQCGAGMPAGSFAIVGVNGGRPFSYNGCLAAEYSAAPASPAPSLYMNSAYSGAYRKNITTGCLSLSAGVAGSNAQRQAWAIGCSEAETSISYANQQGTAHVAMWWIDVETSNSWSSSNLTLNQHAIQGAVARLGQSGLLVGIYSSPGAWAAITGGVFTPQGMSADWEAPGGICASTGFTNSPVWLLQSTRGGFDSDFACQ